MSPPHLTQPGHRIPGAPDCTIVLDPAALAHAGVKPPRKHGAVADSARDIADVADSAGTSSIGGSSRQSSAMQLHHDKLEKSSVEAAADDTNGSSGHLALGVDASASVRRAPRLRTYYVDWLRAFLTVLVVCHHCITCYQSSYAWAAKKGDTALWLLASLFVGANQAYFMTLFFFLSGLYVPGSYRRKGAWQFMQDRTLRLVLPCIVYSLLAPPFILMWNEMAKNPSANVAAAWGSAYRSWLKPGWPSTYVLPTGPPWFVWMLWCFNVAYVVLQLLIRVLPKSWTARPRPRTESTTALNELPEQWAAQQKAQQAWAKAPLTSRATLGYAAALTGVLAVSCYGVRMLDMFVFEIRPSAFVARGPFVSFMPDYLPVYLAAFALGTFSGPSRWDLLARLPAHWGSWCLCVSGVWWLLAGWLLNVTLHSWMSMQRGVTAFVLTWALRTFVEQSFCVFWSIGLLVLFRQAYNVRPNWMGRQFINGAYGAYLVHLPLVYVFARALMHVPFPSAVVNAVAIAPMAVLAAWVLACLLRAIPYADRVL